MKTICQNVTFLVFLVLTASLAFAAEGVSLKMTAQEEVVTIDQEGKKDVKYVETTSVIPGDVVLYLIHYHNQGEKPAEAVVITNPIPEHMQYLNMVTPTSETETTFSIDNEKTFDTADRLFVTMDNGDKRPAIASDYTHIQWRFKNPLPPGSRGSVGYRAQLK